MSTTNPVFFRQFGYKEGAKNSTFEIDLVKQEWSDTQGKYILKGISAGRHTDKFGNIIEDFRTLRFINGVVMLDPKKDAKVIEHLRDRNDNASNKERDQRISPKFYEFNPIAEKQAKLSAQLERAKFVGMIASEAKENDLIEFALAEGISTNLSADKTENIELIKAEIIDRFERSIAAGNSPDKYKAYFTDPRRPIKALVNQCIAKNIISHAGSGVVTHGSASSNAGLKLVEVPTTDIVNWSDYLVDWLSKPKQSETQKALADELKEATAPKGRSSSK